MSVLHTLCPIPSGITNHCILCNWLGNLPVANSIISRSYSKVIKLIEILDSILCSQTRHQRRYTRRGRQLRVHDVHHAVNFNHVFPPVAAQVNVSVLCKKRAHFVFNEAGHFLAASMGLGRYPVLRCIQDLRDLVPFLLRPGA